MIWVLLAIWAVVAALILIIGWGRWLLSPSYRARQRRYQEDLDRYHNRDL